MCGYEKGKRMTFDRVSDKKACVGNKESWAVVPLATFEKRGVIFSLCVCGRKLVVEVLE